MSNRNDGGPAFPKPLDPYPNAQGMESGSLGMSLRDWFAGQALAGLLAAQTTEENRSSSWDQDAKNAYLAADAMLTAREEGR